MSPRGLDRLVARSLLDEAWNHHQAGRWGEQLAAARRARAEAERIEAADLEIRALEAEAVALRMAGRLDEALARASAVLARALGPDAPDLDPSAEEAVASAWMEWAQVARRHPAIPADRARAVVEDGLRWLEARGRAGWRAGLLHERARLRQAAGDLAGALADAEEALALEEAAGDRGGPGYTLASHRWMLADLLRAAGRIAESAALCRAILADPDAGPQDRKAAHQGLARAALADPALGGPEQARYHAERAAGIAERLGPHSRGVALELLAAAARACGDAEGARAAAAEALALAEAGEDPERRAAARRLLAALAEDAGDAAAAARLRAEAEALEEDGG